MRPIHPGEILREEYGIKADNVVGWASKLRYSATQLEAVLNGRAPVDAYLAERLGVLLGTTQAFWLNLQASYQRST